MQEMMKKQQEQQQQMQGMQPGMDEGDTPPPTKSDARKPDPKKGK
jgi:hypothetical protein